MSSNKPNGMPTLPSEWLWKSFDKLCDRISVGHVGETNSFFCGKEGIPFLRSQNVRPGQLNITDIKFVTKDFHEKSKKSQLDPGDILIVRVGQNRGDCAVVPDGMGELNCANIVLAKPNRKYSNYLGYFFNSTLGREALLALSSGSAQLVLNTKAIAKVIVPVPPEKDALEIGLFLKSLDDSITLLRETNTTLEAIAQTLFKSWFVDFDPVHAKQQDREPEGMDADTAALFPDSFEESELGLVPKGWRIGKVGDFAKQHKGSISPLNNPQILFEHFSLPAFDNRQMPVSELGTEIKSNKTAVPVDAVLLSKLNPHIPRVWLPVDVGCHAVCSTEFLVFVPASGASREFIYCAFTMTQFQQMLCQLVTGTSNSHQRVKPDGISGISAVIPNTDVLKVFAATVKPIFKQIGHNRLQAQNLATIRDALLPRLITGQLRLTKAEAIIETTT